jgi:DNA mismatch endonuclease (patch repair protein)
MTMAEYKSQYPDAITFTRNESRIAKMASTLIGKKLSAEHKAKCSVSHTGLKRSSETCEKIRQKAIGRKASEETRRILSESHKGIRCGFTGKSKPADAFADTLMRFCIEFERELWIPGFTGSYDFYFRSLNLIVEFDGCYWHGCPIHYPNPVQLGVLKKMKIDPLKTEHAIKKGYKVIRLWECKVQDSILNMIDQLTAA